MKYFAKTSLAMISDFLDGTVKFSLLQLPPVELYQHDIRKTKIFNNIQSVANWCLEFGSTRFEATSDVF